jgi:hypothetical protein
MFILSLAISFCFVSGIHAQNVGIGITNPAFKLDVAHGSINTDSMYRIGSLQVLSINGLTNTFVGQEAGKSTTGYGNTFTGHKAGYSNTSGSDNAFFGRSCGQSNGIGGGNSFFGSFSGYANTSGSGNSFFGNDAGKTNTIGGFNSYFGIGAGSNNLDGTNNAFFGFDAGSGSASAGGTGNSFFGTYAGFALSSGGLNSFFGNDAGYNNNVGSSNVAIGAKALKYSMDASYIVAIGAEALINQTTDVTGTYKNTAVGYWAGHGISTGYYNSYFGAFAGNGNSVGYRNSSVGVNSLQTATGTYNSALGAFADVNNSTAIGDGVHVDSSNKVLIGDVGVGSIGGAVGWTTFSDGRYKQQVREEVPGLPFILRLRPVTYIVDLPGLELRNHSSDKYTGNDNNLSPEVKQWKHATLLHAASYRQTGFIAQEVEKTARAIGFTFSGVDAPANPQALYGLRYGEFVVPLVKAVQEQNAIIEEQNKKIELLVKEIQLIKEKMK